ncbi:hypothetical protein, conserved [Babesia bigemina]|uniref:WD domain, G-beta repeat containing protein n=1 Tax=Babesia bigemina TaxID=5866 RepID=A0A061DDI8_BABBI|nr:hypothetical protein, conserved [Babesia bigemina]CDR97459.1 hypothetical protein, conserved [Babesia bigemina]|eukprot:XP_012769645.1 hypothetical protein, conserved [Babesia bigemina]
MVGTTATSDQDGMMDYEDSMSTTEQEPEPIQVPKKSAVMKMLKKMELGDVYCVKCIRRKKIKPAMDSALTGDELGDLYDHLATGNETEKLETTRENDEASANRGTAFFNKVGDTHEHYMKHFAAGSLVDDVREDETTDSTDMHLDDEVTEPVNYPGVSPLQSSVFCSMEEIRSNESHIPPETSMSAQISIDMQSAQEGTPYTTGLVSTLSAIDEPVSDQPVDTASDDEGAMQSVDMVNDETTHSYIAPETATLDNIHCGSDSTVEKLDIIGTKESAPVGELMGELTAVMIRPTEFSSREKKDVPMGTTVTTTKADNSVTPSTAADAFATSVTPKETPLAPTAETKIKPDGPIGQHVDTRSNPASAESSSSVAQLKRADAKDYGAMVDADKKKSVASVLTATATQKKTAPKLLTMQEAMQVNAKAGALSAMTLSPGKDVLALGTERGILTVFITAEADMRNTRRKKQKPADVADNDPMPDSMLWGLMAISPQVSTEAHLTAINNIRIVDIELDGEGDARAHTNEIATIVTSGADTYVRVWSLHQVSNEYMLTLIGAQVMGNEPVAAVPNFAHDQMLVAFADGLIQHWKVTDRGSPEMNRQHKLMFSETKGGLDAMCDVLSVDVSPTGQTFAVESAAGWLVLYDSKTKKEVGSADCRNGRGKWSNGADVTGVDWSKKENLILVTTSDCRIRMLTATAYEEGELLDLEKFKGHHNVEMPFKAQFANNDEYVVCPCENGFIYVWKINVDTSKKNIGEDDMQPTNSQFVRFKFNAPKILPHLAIFDPGEWKHLRQMIMQQEKNGVTDVTQMPQASCKCLPFGKHFTTPQSIAVADLDTQEHILLVAPENSGFLRYSLISLAVLQRQFK